MASEDQDIILELGDKKYKLRRTYPALCKMERALGQGIVELANRMAMQQFGVHDLAVIVEAAAAAGGHEVKLENIGEEIAAVGVNAVAPKVLEYLSSALTGRKAAE